MPSPRKYSGQRSIKARKIAASMLPSPCSICQRAVLSTHNWQADHITPRAIAEAQGWPATEIDSAANIAPSHASCNTRAGAALGNKLRAKAKATPRTVPIIKRPQLGGRNV